MIEVQAHIKDLVRRKKRITVDVDYVGILFSIFFRHTHASLFFFVTMNPVSSFLTDGYPAYLQIVPLVKTPFKKKKKKKGLELTRLSGRLSTPLVSSRSSAVLLSTKATCAAKATGTTDRVLELLDNSHVGHDAFLDDELRDAVVLLDLEVDVGQVGEEDSNRATVVSIDDACESVDTMLEGEARARGDTAIWLVIVYVLDYCVWQ